jgi:hypothetical protein
MEPQCLPDIRLPADAAKASKEAQDPSTLVIDFGKVSIGEISTLGFEVINAGFVGAKFWVRHGKSELQKTTTSQAALLDEDDIETSNADCMFLIEGLQQQNPKMLVFSGQIMGYTTMPLNVRFNPKTLGGRFRSEFFVDFLPPNVEKMLSRMDSMAGSNFIMNSSFNNLAGRAAAAATQLNIEGLIQRKLVLYGEVVDLPIFMERDHLDFQWTKVDGCYREKIVIRNRTSVVQRFTVAIQSNNDGAINETKVIGNSVFELENLGSFELSPNVGFVQPTEPFAVWVKFKPSVAAVEKYGNGDIPFEIKLNFYAAKHHLPVPVSIEGHVTSTEVSINPTEIDFGSCSIYDGIVKTVNISSGSKLCTKFGFVDLPNFVEVQPGDGFGTLLPLETLSRDITFAPKLPGPYNFALTLKTTDGKVARINCKGVATQPLMRFLEEPGNLLEIPKIGAGSQYTLSTVLAMPVEEGAVLALAKKRTAMFEFVLPLFDGVDENQQPKWKHLDFQGGEKSENEHRLQPFQIYPRVGKLRTGEKTVVHISFLANWSGIFATDDTEGQSFTWKIPCLIKPMSSSTATEVIFLEVRATIVRPSFQLAGDITTKVDFGQIPINVLGARNLFFRNTKPDVSTKLFVSGLDPFGPFNMPMELAIPPNQSAKFPVEYRPNKKGTAFEQIEVRSEDGVTILKLKLFGEAVVPSVVVEPRNMLLNMEDVLLGEVIQRSFYAHNTSSFNTSITIKLLRDGRMNKDGKHAFEVAPTSVIIGPGKRQEFSVKFKPDHESDAFTETVSICVEGRNKPYRMKLCGRCWSSTTFVSPDQDSMLYRIHKKANIYSGSLLEAPQRSATMADDLLAIASRIQPTSTGGKELAAQDIVYRAVKSDSETLKPIGVDDVVGNIISTSALTEVVGVLASERGTGLSAQLTDELKPAHPLNAVGMPLSELASCSGFSGHSSRAQFFNIPCQWKLVSGKVESLVSLKQLESTSSSIVALDASSLESASQPLFRIEGHFFSISNMKPWSNQVESNIKQPVDIKKLGNPACEFEIEQIDVNEELDPELQLWLQRQRAFEHENATMKQEHGLKFTVDGATSGTIEYGAQRVVRIGLVGPKMERLDFLDKKVVTPRPNTAASAATDKDQSVKNAVRKPLYVETLFKVTLKGGYQIMEKHQGQPLVEGAIQPSYQLAVSNFPNELAGKSYASTFAKAVNDAQSSRVWFVRAFALCEEKH